jgi:hypothetical protein
VTGNGSITANGGTGGTSYQAGLSDELDNDSSAGGGGGGVVVFFTTTSSYSIGLSANGGAGGATTFMLPGGNGNSGSVCVFQT